MKKVSCDIIKDILPLYLDSVVSDDTKEMVEEHLKTCDFCRKEAAALKKVVALPVNQKLQFAEARALKTLRSYLLKRKVIISIVSVIMAFLVMMGLYSYAVLSKTCIQYDEEIIKINEADGKLYAVYCGESLGGTVSINPLKMMIDGREKKVTAFYYYQTPWSKYIEPIFTDDSDNRMEETVFYLGKKEDIDQVYYGEFVLDGSNINHETMDVRKLHMVWNR